MNRGNQLKPAVEIVSIENAHIGEHMLLTPSLFPFHSARPSARGDEYEYRRDLSRFERIFFSLLPVSVRLGLWVGSDPELEEQPSSR